MWSVGLWSLPAPPTAAQQLTLRVTLARGGTEIAMDLSSTHPPESQEATLTITSTTGAQYRLFQELSSPLVNEHGHALPEGTIVFTIGKGEVGSVPSRGLLTLSRSPAELYTSNASGSSDELQLVYTTSGERPDRRLSAGSYRGAVTYTVQALDGSKTATETLNLLVTVEPVFQLSRIDPGATSALSFGELDPGSRTVQEIALQITSNLGTSVRLVQEFQALTAASGMQLPLDRFRAVVMPSGAELTVASHSQDLWVSSGEEPPVNLILRYLLELPQDQRADRYEGLIAFRLESDAGRQETLMLPVEAVVNPVFMMMIENPLGGADLDFGKLSPCDRGPERRLTVAMNSNLGRPYELSQALLNPLATEDGSTLPDHSLTSSTAESPRGTALLMTPQPLTTSAQTVFRSHPEGGTDTALFSYQLAIPCESRGGIYRSTITFTLTSF